VRINRRRLPINPSRLAVNFIQDIDEGKIFIVRKFKKALGRYLPIKVPKPIIPVRALDAVQEKVAEAVWQMGGVGFRQFYPGAKPR